MKGRTLRHGIWLVALTLAAGCASAPERKPVAIDLQAPDGWTAPEAPPAAGKADASWWRSFEDDALDGLVREALLHNHDILAAAARVEQSVAQARLAGADVWPQLNATGNASRARNNIIGFPTPDGSVIQTRSNSFSASLALSWELDLWGRIRKGHAAALADVERSWAELAAVRLSIAAQTTKAWLGVIEARQQVTLSEAIVESFATSAEQIRRRYQQGVRSSVDLRLSLASLSSAEAALAARRQQLDASRRRLETLLGRYPAAAIDDSAALPVVKGDVPGGLPSELLIRRPDLLAAERAYAASEARVSEARRAFFPRITLTGSAGTLSGDLSDLTDLDFGVWSIAAGIVQPIFQGGRIRANLALSHAVADQALVAYVQSLLGAFSEVENALVAESALSEQEQHLEVAATQAEAARQLAERQYDAGLIDYITFLETQRQSFNSRIELLNMKRLRLDARVNLHVALGGGFDLEKDWMEFLQASQPNTQQTGGSR